MPSAQQITGQNHVADVDAYPGLSRLHDDILILKDFADMPVSLETSMVHLGVLVAGFEEDISDFIALTRGLVHLPTSRCKRGVRAAVIVGSVEQWRLATVEGCRASGPVQAAFNNLYGQMVQMGLGWVFDSYKPKETFNGLFLLENK